MVYLTYAEGFTEAGEPVVTIGANSVVPAGGTRVSPTQARIPLPAEVIDNTEIGLRSDWLDGRLRFNATYFDSDWNGMRVTLLPLDALGNTQPFPYNSGEGAGTASGFEFEVVYAATERLTLNFGLGLIDTEYIQSGVFDGVTGNYPGAPFAYAADESGTIGVQYEIPTGNGGRFLLVGNAGYMGDYSRDAAYQRTLIDPVTLQPVLEPAYTIVNTRFVYEPPARNFAVEDLGQEPARRAVRQRRVRYSRHVGLRLLDRRSLARSRCRDQLRVLSTTGRRCRRHSTSRRPSGRLLRRRLLFAAANGGSRCRRRSS